MFAKGFELSYKTYWRKNNMQGKIKTDKYIILYIYFRTKDFVKINKKWTWNWYTLIGLNLVFSVCLNNYTLYNNA